MIYATDLETAGDLLEADRSFYRDVLRLPLEFVHQHVARTLGEDLADRLAVDLGVTRPMPPRDVRLRRAALGRECQKLYDAVSFYNYSRGRTMSTFLTVSYAALGVEDHRQAMRYHGMLNKKLANFLDVGLMPKVPHRRRDSVGERMEPAEHAYVYVAENMRDRGFHIHQLMCVPPAVGRPGGVGRRIYEARMLVPVLEEWFADRLGRVVPSDAIHLKYHAPKSDMLDLEWQWRVTKYIQKLTSDGVRCRDADGNWVSVREVFGLEPYVETCPVWCAQLAGGSHNLWTKSQKGAGFVSRFQDYCDSELYSDWALRAFRERVEAERRASEFDELLESLSV